VAAGEAKGAVVVKAAAGAAPESAEAAGAAPVLAEEEAEPASVVERVPVAALG
jgi:hypothetical protein